MKMMSREQEKVYRKFTKKRSVFSRIAITVGITLSLLLLIGATCFAFLFFKGSFFEKPKRGSKLPPILKPEVPKQPVNMLLLGSDRRKREVARSDTLIFLRVFPKERKAVILSIPRDYRVRIPGYGKRKINSAYAFGGPKLTIETIEDFTGFPVNHYLELNFTGFIKLVDELGGIDIFVEKELREHRETFSIALKPGWHHLDGKTALQFVRFRHDAEGDFGRMKRQQQFFKALSEKSIKLTNIWKLPKLAGIARDYTITDLSASEMFSLGWLLKGIPRENLITFTLPGDVDMINGVSYVVPDKDKVQELFELAKKPAITKQQVDRIVYGKVLMSEATLKERKERESIKLAILNGSETSGIAREVAYSFRNLGFDLTYCKSASRSNFPKSLLIYTPGLHTKALKVAKAFGYCDLIEARTPLDVDVRLIVGNDYVLREHEH